MDIYKDPNLIKERGNIYCTFKIIEDWKSNSKY